MRIVPFQVFLFLPILLFGNTVQAVRVAEPIVIDGILSESTWQNAPSVSDFFQREPNEGALASQKTLVRIAYDDHVLYVGAEMYDSAPDSIVARVSRRDNILKEDFFGIALDTYHDHRSGFFFGLSAGGTMADGTLYNDDWLDESWDGVWEGKVRRTSFGWVAEMGIPFSQLRFKKQNQYEWGVNFFRQIARKNEEVYLVYTPKASSGFVSRFPHLVGIENIQPGRHIGILPYTRTKALYTHPASHDPFHKKSTYSPDAGMDMKVGLRHNLTLDITLNPDFGQVEVDPAVVNLSDVETYFQEKRPFFIEGASIFNFGQGGSRSYWNFNWWNPRLFYSRRIGRAPQGSLPENEFADIPKGAHILGAGKVTGKLFDSWNVGTLHAVTRKEVGRFSLNGNRFRAEVEPLSYYGVVRIQKEVNDSRQGIGFLSTLTARDFSDTRLQRDFNAHAEVFGIDGWTFFDSSKTWVLAGWIAGSKVAGSHERILGLQTSSRHYFQCPDLKHVRLDSQATTLDGFAGRFVLNKQKGNFLLNSAIGFLSPGFDVNDLGFLNRADLINAHLGWGYYWDKPGKIFRETNILFAIFQSYDFGWNSIGRGLFFLWEGQFLNYYRVHMDMGYNPKSIDKFRTRGGPLTLNHEGNWYRFWGRSDDRKPWVLQIFGFRYFSRPKEQNIEVGMNIEWKPKSNWSLSVGPSWSWVYEYAQWVNVFDDPTTTHTYGKRYVFGEMKQKELGVEIRCNWTFTPQLSLQLYLQPLISHGNYEHFKELKRPKTGDYHVYTEDQIIRSGDTYEVDPDGTGPAPSFTFDNPDFAIKSLRGNAVLRWEYKPGSTLYLVWTQNRWDNTINDGTFSFSRSASHLVHTRPDNILMIKWTYWWNL